MHGLIFNRTYPIQSGILFNTATDAVDKLDGWTKTKKRHHQPNWLRDCLSAKKIFIKQIIKSMHTLCKFKSIGKYWLNSLANINDMNGQHLEDSH